MNLRLANAVELLDDLNIKDADRVALRVEGIVRYLGPSERKSGESVEILLVDVDHGETVEILTDAPVRTPRAARRQRTRSPARRG